LSSKFTLSNRFSHYNMHRTFSFHLILDLIVRSKWWRIEITKLLIAQFSSASFYYTYIGLSIFHDILSSKILLWESTALSKRKQNSLWYQSNTTQTRSLLSLCAFSYNKNKW
jgi:hypothetical protein